MDRRHFVLKRMHSLSGVVPVGAFLLEHLWTNARAVYGRESFNHAVGELQALPALAWIELFGILLPLTFHGVYGLVIAAQGRPNALRYGFTRNWLYVLQRVSGVVAFAFIALHLWQYRAQKLLGVLPWEDLYTALMTDLSSPRWFVVYFLGITASVFHFANGLWLFGNTWGVTVSEKSMRRAGVACTALGLLLWVLGVNTLLHFSYRCGGVVPMPEQELVQGNCRNPDDLPPRSP
jgi:succinate dehydrogenase/fumarate reductase cytochrome b subunit (b558 family)